MKKVALVNANSFGRYFPKYIDQLEKEVGPVTRLKLAYDIDARSLDHELKDFTYIIAGTTPRFSREFFELNNSVRYIARFGIGYNNIDVAAARACGRYVSNMPGHLEKEDVAEQAVSLALALLKHVVDGNEAVHSDEWDVRRERFLGRRIHGKKVGVVGLGQIGSTFARIMSKGFSCEVIAYDPYLREEDYKSRCAARVDLDELVSRSDIVSLHANLTEENRHLINKTRIASMKRNAILINTARGELVDEQALAAALNAGQINGYGADVIENEPPSPDHPLLKARNTVITPHLGTYNRDCNEEMCACIVNDIIRVDGGGMPTNLLEK